MVRLKTYWMIKPYLKTTGKQERIRLFKFFGLFQFYSICGVHKHHLSQCENCKAGKWRFLPVLKLRQLFYKFFPNTWRKIRNSK